MDYLIKVVLFAIFLAAVYAVIDIFMNFLRPFLETIPITPFLCKFGFFTGLNLFLSIVISGFAIKQILSFWK